MKTKFLSNTRLIISILVVIILLPALPVSSGVVPAATQEQLTPPTAPSAPQPMDTQEVSPPLQQQGPAIQSTPLYTDTLTADGRIVPVLPPAEQPQPLAVVTELGPTQANVALALRDRTGNPVTTACVQAYSEDWKVVMPRRWERVCADATGTAIMQLPVGRWSFFASGPAYFVPLLDRSITGNTLLPIQPSSSLSLELRDFGGVLFSGVDVYLIESQRKPLLPPAYVGSTASGRLEVAVGTGLSYEVLLVRQPPAGTSDGTAFFVHPGAVSAGTTLNYQMRSDQLGRIRFNLTNAQGTPGPRSYLEVKFPGLSPDFDISFGRGNGSWWGQLQLWVSPEPLTAAAHELANDWNFGFGPDVLEPQAGTSLDYMVGGPLDVKVWFYPLLDDGRQVWVQARDAGGHTLVYFSHPDGMADIPIKLRSGGQLVYDGVLQHHNLTGLLTMNPQGLQYEVNLDLGFLGTYVLQGQALGPDSTWALEPITTTHFIIHWPTQMHTQAQTIGDIAEQSYAATAATLGHTTESLHSHGKIEAHFPFYCECAGWAGGSTFAVMVEYLTYGDALSPRELGEFKITWAHELVHIFQGTGTGLSNYSVTGWFGEPFASFAGYLGMESIYGGNLGFYWVIRDLEGLFFWLPEGENRLDGGTCYVLNAVRRLYTMQAHRDWIQFWGGSTLPNRSCLDNLGLTDAEGIAVGYSYIVPENLGWLFREARFDISDARVQEGLDAIATCKQPVSVYLPIVTKNR